MKNNLIEGVLALVLVVLAVLLINPMHLWMPDTGAMLVLVLAVAAAAAWGIFVMREQAGDEREEAHRAAAGRAAFLAGGAVLVIGIVVEELSHSLDPWLVYALVAMVLAKYASRLWSERRS